MYNSSQFIMNKIFFDGMGVAIEDYNMHGYNLVGTSLSWKPFMANENCDNTGRNCQNYGLVADLMDIWGKNYNFTWEVYADLDNDWGMFPLEGTPYNISGKWKGVMGDIVEGKYQLTINAWLFPLYRISILDFVPITKDGPILCLIPKLPEVDPGLFIRQCPDIHISTLLLFTTLDLQTCLKCNLVNFVIPVMCKNRSTSIWTMFSGHLPMMLGQSS